MQNPRQRRLGTTTLNHHYLREVTISVFGLDKVGKTSLINRFLYNKYDSQYKQTVEDIYRGDITYKEQKCDLTIIDMGGYRQFPAMRRLAIQKSDGFLLVYSIDSIPSLKEAKRLYDIVVEVKGSNDVPILLVGGKADISLRRISSSEISPSLVSWGNRIQRIEASAELDINVRTTFLKLIEMIDDHKNEPVNTSVVNETNRHPLIRKASAGLVMPLMQCAKKESSEEDRKSIISGCYDNEDCSTSLLNITISPILPGLTRYIQDKH